MHYKDLSGDLLDQIIYRGEGNSSIVIALRKQAKVIRLLKKDGKIMRSSQDHHVTQHPMRNIKFIHLIMKPLAEPFLSAATELIHLKSDFINRLSKRVEAHRPLHRLNKTLLLDDQYALVMDDLCALPIGLTRHLQPGDLCGPTISVEIKPKQGFLPMHRLAMKASSTVNDQLAIRMKNCCLYGSAQHLKLARGRINRTSDYCPINLFSGCPIRMRSALEALISNPQNNLRVFKDLLLAYGESCGVKLSNIFEDFFESDETSPNRSSHTRRIQPTNEERFVDLLIQCLLNGNDDEASELHKPSTVAKELSSTLASTEDENSFSQNDSCLKHTIKNKCRRCDIYPPPKRHKSDPPNPSIHALPKSCVLSSVLRAQKLDSIGAHEALNMLEWLQENTKSDNGIDVLEELSTPHMPAGFGSQQQLPCETKQQYYFRKVWEFLVSLTAKDCSIIITLRRVNPNRYESIIERGHNSIRRNLLKDQRTGTYYMFNVGIADLDQKMPLKIARICDNLNLILLQDSGDHSKRDGLTAYRLSSQKIFG